MEQTSDKKINSPIIKGVQYYPNFIENPKELFEFLDKNCNWDTSMKARKTVSFGVPYNYGQMSYENNNFPKQLQEINEKIEKKIGFLPNNCLINYYEDGLSRMGYHSDRTDNLEPNTGVVIISLGETRLLKYRKIPQNNNDNNDNQNENENYDKNWENKNEKNQNQEFWNYYLEDGSLAYQSLEIQKTHQHSVPMDKGIKNPRMSLTFRRVIQNKN
ncbi:hypothetical protein PPERSA_02509 [Pseudocohnilembus persalinus]|uniref:Fe2OG dioxygenase domain-containing protein n=1 Tax=Pseudocohnilembus persalinus TaxID=266149 RepID=A0A0V0QB13_PSEPJ|nr:hypothetical protein PPERSA_02509 [Pseudocohnilembus persalinus]|eukprot:KRW99397.1 hypothetical protein PPERSA_02509 [Pseudocohnilembus persalinus]